MDAATNYQPSPMFTSETVEIKEMGCGPAQHEFQSVGGGFSRPFAIFCTKCGDIRELPKAEPGTASTEED